MIRIAHVSDLHIFDGTSPIEWSEPWHQKVIRFIEQEKGFKLEIGAHDDNRVEALRTKLVELQPHVLVCTGDISTFGDAKSLAKGARLLDEMARDIAVARGDDAATMVLAVPGNHDALQERFLMLRQHTRFGGRFLLAALESFHKDLRIIAQKQDASSSSLAPRNQPTHLGSYESEVASKLSCSPNPGEPKIFKTPWGQIRFYLFNSVNDPGWMANEGRIGAYQYNQLAHCLGKELKAEEKGELDVNVMRIALLHHHPLPIPYLADPSYERFYNAMQDGSTLCHFLNAHRFQMVLHGHQHQPYNCGLVYSGSSPLQVIAAGTATQAMATGDQASFNILEVHSPFDAELTRFLYRETGFEREAAPSVSIQFKLPMSSKFTPGTSDEQDLQNFLRPNKAAEECDHQLELLSFTSRVGTDHTYRSMRRLKGRCLKDGSVGILQTITGSPEQDWKDLKLRAYWTKQPDRTVAPKVVNEHPRQYTFYLLHEQPAKKDYEFDYTCEFEWKNAPPDDTYFDGINLYRYNNDITKLFYQIELWWDPPQRTIEKIGLRQATLSMQISREPFQDPETQRQMYRFSFELERPERVAFLIHLPKLP